MSWKFIAIFLTGINLFIQKKTHSQVQDTLFLYKGEIFIGNIRGGELGNISFDETILKLINIKLYRIRTLKTWRRFKIQTASRQIYYGVMKDSKKDGWTTIVLDNGDSVQMKITDIDIITTLE